MSASATQGGHNYTTQVENVFHNTSWPQHQSTFKV